MKGEAGMEPYLKHHNGVPSYDLHQQSNIVSTIFTDKVEAGREDATNHHANPHFLSPCFLFYCFV